MATRPMPSVREMIDSHTLAEEIITRHGSVDDVLDDSELRLLKRFCDNPSSKDAILQDEGMADRPDDYPGARAVESRGSLVGFCIATHNTVRPALQDKEIQRLRNWFASQPDMQNW